MGSWSEPAFLLTPKMNFWEKVSGRSELVVKAHEKILKQALSQGLMCEWNSSE